MNTHIKTTNIALTDAISDYVNKRLLKIEKLTNGDSSAQCDVELARTTTHHNKGEVFRAEIHLVGAAGLNIYTSIEREDLYTAIDEVRDAVIREFTGNRKKKMSRIRRGGARIKEMVKGMWPWRRN
ncbi:MAG: ribosomal subunit interface protein [Candidatus Taylorbacteria bacterium RIFCSPHIGHO2_02_FULL_45_28]|uniref:Ribosomal subunit interface protein n=1 Tax=Candidatus Taylorbacteria bacterium RIFCSPHIGHO2_12_FULL_45_16 TaxID=1802315 RepID=A0A1G2MZF2_9BACT|nr:MAG: ribosomal subunit interface protein [Candidatus Taylorbacteria bacterium RIFCSPHIGHO2_01_FULL_44_110]OHA25516.1 MAG: ribosomal subunit interface protein [Candidatus Taylorbacteria bacterium RIFCSPHIGHO2_02_FULL_45_28]OHA29183.1 MAG: ribosomal subunit interface protein [Candidatus Taylorbacteria bacterium RIFCSPHIGHO2_12_FULL_45_16]OHA33405.1 MAG: ribosomal subunit interface protein [Candidatus Taylorbacteria bacterium RIFCSPLOWO2_01_FULL_45_59]OHA39491.1 MAG: ribosomal subunit interface